MTKTQNELIAVAVLLGAHGVRGDCRIKSFTADPASVLELGPLRGEGGNVLLTPKGARTTKDQYIVTPEEQRQKEEWDALKGTLLHIRRDDLPDPEEDAFYVEDLVGLAAISPAGERLGHVKAVHNFGAGDLLEILPDVAEGAVAKSVFVPFSLVDVPEVDLAARQVQVATLAIWADETGKPDPVERETGEPEAGEPEAGEIER